MRTFQSKATAATPAAERSAPIAVSRATGHPLPPTVRSEFESLLGHDFSQVRIHHDDRAAATARSFDAKAFTIGRDVFFGAGNYAPATGEGRRLLAHELTHVTQDRPWIQRAPNRPSSSPASTPWDQVRGAQPTLESSFTAYQGLHPRSPKRPWMWKHRHSAKDCYNKNLTPAHQLAVRNVYEAMVRQRLWKFVGVVTKPIEANVQGIEFREDPAHDLKKHVMSSTDYCRDPWAKSTKWRQVVLGGTAGLHITPAASGDAQVHIDRISPITGRDAAGDCVTSYLRHLVQHGKEDLFGIYGTSLRFGPTIGVASSSRGTALTTGADLTLAHNFLSTLNDKLHLQGRAQLVLNNVLASLTLGLGGAVEHGNVGAYASGGLTIGAHTSRVLGRTGGKVGGLTGTVGAYFRLPSLAAQLGIEASAMKSLVTGEPDLYQFVAMGVLRF